MAQTTATLSSTGFSAAIYLTPYAKQTVIQVSQASSIASGTSSGTSFVQFTLDDPSVTPAPSVTWCNLSSGINSSSIDGGIGATYSVVSPLSGLRMAVVSSTTTGVVNAALTLKAIQSITG